MADFDRAKVLVLFISCFWASCHAQELEFAGKELITYDLTENRVAAEQNRITFRFKTINSFGLIFYSKGTQGDYLTLELVEGSLRYQCDLGSTSKITSKQELTVGNDLSNNVWHSVDIIRNRNKVNITIDGKHEKSIAFGSASFTRLDLDNMVFVGGVFDDLRLKPDLGLMSRRYIGCLANFLFDDISILYNAKYNKKYFRPHGDIKYRCRNIEYIPVSFPDYKSIIEIPTFVEKSFTAQLSFRTYVPNSMILSKISNDSNIFLEIRAGRLVIRVESSKFAPIKLRVGKNVNDGNWHAVDCTVSTESVSITLDKGQKLEIKQLELKAVRHNAKYVTLGGGADNILRGFEGCVYRVTIDGTFIDARILERKNIKGAVVDKCQEMNKCWPNPCQNGGRCKQFGANFLCDCTSTLYSGKTCKDPIVQKTCQDYKLLGLTEDSYCYIDPDGKGPLHSFEVLCNMTKQQSAITIIPLQNSLQRTRVDQNTQLILTKYYQQMAYPMAMDKIAALINVSSHCRQFVRFECKNSPLLNSPRGPPAVSWVNREGLLESYWGGAPKGSEKCACGVKKTCTDSSKYCNCDIADNFWREDSGFLNDKSALPVTSIQFDAKAAKSYFTIGNLECTSSEVRRRLSTDTPLSSVALRACRPLFAKKTTTLRPTTRFLPELPQTEKVITKSPKSKDDATRPNTKFEPSGIHTVAVKPKQKNGSGRNNTSNAPKASGKNHDGVTISMSILAVIVISASIVLVWAIIAVIVIVKRRRRDSRRDRAQDRDQSHEEGTEMCILFRQSKRETPRPTIELRRDSYDSYDSVPTPALEYTQHTGFRQPITTHITLDYARAKKKKNGSVYSCS